MGELIGWLLALVMGAVVAAGVVIMKASVLAFRFATGLPLNGNHTTDATFFTRGTASVHDDAHDWWGIHKFRRWSYLAGWEKAAIRWAVVAAAVGYFLWPTLTIVIVVAGAVGTLSWAGYRYYKTREQRRHVKDVVRPLYQVLAQYLGTPIDADPNAWVEIPRDFRDNESARLLVGFPPGFDPTPRKRQIADVVRRHIGTQWEPIWSPAMVEWKRSPAPPKTAKYQGHNDPMLRIHLGEGSRGKKIVADLGVDSPHMFIAAPSGTGKSTMLRLPTAHIASKGGLIDIIDPKRRSFLGAFNDVPGIRIHTTIKSQMWAFEEFYLSLLGVNTAVEQGEPEENFPCRFLVIDEFGTFMSAARTFWKRLKARKLVESSAEPPFVNQYKFTLWQGRQANHRVIVGVHQASREVFIDTDARQQFGLRLTTGPFNGPGWVTTYGRAPRMSWNGKHKGRSIIGLGEDENSLQEFQLAFLDEKDSRELALSGPGAPDWFTNKQPAPWITQEILDEADDIAGVYQVSLPETDVYHAGTTPSRVPGTPDNLRAPILTVNRSKKSEENSEKITNSDDSESQETAVMPIRRGHLQLVSNDNELVVGNDEAAKFLNFNSVDSFRKARKRSEKDNPLREHSRTEDDRPCYTRDELRSWQSKRQVAGRRWAEGDEEATP